jgi:hypothetical protein
VKKFLIIPAVLVVVGLAACGTMGAPGYGSAGGYGNSASSTGSSASMGSSVPNMIDYGYPHVLATVYLDPGQKAKIMVPDQYTTGKTYGYATYTIPAGAFTVPVKFEILAAANSAWDKQVPKDESVVANFAYRVTDMKTGKPIEKFDKPILYSVDDSMITTNSVYWATTPTSPVQFKNVNAGSKISGNTLEHETPVTIVGWVITTPKSDLQAMGMAGM